MGPRTTCLDVRFNIAPNTFAQDQYNSKCDKSLHGVSSQPLSMCGNLSPTFYDVRCPSSSNFSLGLSLHVILKNIDRYLSSELPLPIRVWLACCSMNLLVVPSIPSDNRHSRRHWPHAFNHLGTYHLCHYGVVQKVLQLPLRRLHRFLLHRHARGWYMLPQWTLC
jgi:hypothetical protein